MDDSSEQPHRPHFTPAMPVPPEPADPQFARDARAADDVDQSSGGELDDLDWGPIDGDSESEISAADIQRLYLKALEASEGIEEFSDADASEVEIAEDASDSIDVEVDLLDRTTAVEPDELQAMTSATFAAETMAAEPQPPGVGPAPPGKIPATVRQSLASTDRPDESPLPTLTPTQILEAILFVGGGPLTAKRLCGVLGGNLEPHFVEQRIDEMNIEYSSQGRPYEIRLGEGGYRLTLRPEFEMVRNKVYGAGPREVRLSQDAKEVLALVAYHQPISHADVEASGKKNAGNLLRQLIRRELIGIHRVDSTRNGIRYQTTPRFLSLFRLASLNELPKADELSLR